MVKILTFLMISALCCLAAQAELTFEKTVVEHDAQPGESSFTGKFPFENKGSKTVQIRKVQSSCKCTVAQLKDRTIDPGETGVIEATFEYGRRSGEQHKAIRVITDENPRGYQLKMDVFIPQLVEVSPPFHNWAHGVENRELSFEIKLDGAENVTLKDVSLQNQADFSGRLEEVAAGSHYRYHVKPVSTEKFVKSPIKIQVQLPGAEERQFQAFVLVSPPPVSTMPDRQD